MASRLGTGPRALRNLPAKARQAAGSLRKSGSTRSRSVYLLSRTNGDSRSASDSDVLRSAVVPFLNGRLLCRRDMGQDRKPRVRTHRRRLTNADEIPRNFFVHCVGLVATRPRVPTCRSERNPTAAATAIRTRFVPAAFPILKSARHCRRDVIHGGASRRGP